VPVGVGGLVFGTLLGPESTGPVGWAAAFWVVVRLVGFVCFWFPGCTDHTVDSPWWGLSGVKARFTDECFVAGAQGWNINE
jgi:hypothetical protein